jgi:murein L,D-transpeptidase YafK
MSGRARILIKKSQRRLILTAGDGSVRAYPVDLGRNWAADKAVEGDHATPLGDFYVCAKNPRSKFFLSLCISYPNAEDARRGLASGLISAAEHDEIIEALRLGRIPPQHTRLGGEIYIHGRPQDFNAAERDWTRGCIALDNAAIQEIYTLTAIGSTVSIVD